MRSMIAAALLLATPAFGQSGSKLICVREETTPLIRGYRLPPLTRLGPPKCYWVIEEAR
jgi:hypothetical protein